MFAGGVWRNTRKIEDGENQETRSLRIYNVSRLAVNVEYFAPTTYRASCERELEDVPMKLGENLALLISIIKKSMKNCKPLYLTVEEQILCDKTSGKVITKEKFETIVIWLENIWVQHMSVTWKENYLKEVLYSVATSRDTTHIYS